VIVKASISLVDRSRSMIDLLHLVGQYHTTDIFVYIGLRLRTNVSILDCFSEYRQKYHESMKCVSIEHVFHREFCKIG
jgi:hypothetical protein